MCDFFLVRSQLKLLLCSTVLCVAFSVQAADVGSCEQYMWSTPVERQCGETCAIYSFKNVLEGLIRRKLSSEYALLATVAMDLKARDKALSVRDYKPEKYMELPVHEPDNIFGIDAIIAFANYGIYLAYEFPLKRTSKKFHERFNRDLSEENILSIHAEAIKHMNAAINAANAGNLSAAEEEINQYRFMSYSFEKFMLGFSLSAKSEWQRRYAGYRFEVIQVRKNAFSDKQAGWYKYLFQTWLPDQDLASVTNYTADKFKARVLLTLASGIPIYISGRNEGKDDGHAVVGFSYFQDPSPVMAVRNSGAQDADDPSTGALHTVDFVKVGFYYDFAIIPVPK